MKKSFKEFLGEASVSTSKNKHTSNILFGTKGIQGNAVLTNKDVVNLKQTLSDNKTFKYTDETGTSYTITPTKNNMFTIISKPGGLSGSLSQKDIDIL